MTSFLKAPLRDAPHLGQNAVTRVWHKQGFLRATAELAASVPCDEVEWQILMSTEAFLSHSHADGPWVEALARRLEDECGFKVWLDKWVLVPGKSWQQAIARGLEETGSCAVFIGATTARGWFQEVIERALDLQTRNPDFRVIPVLLPDADPSVVPGFLSLRTWADFRAGQDQDYAFHVLRQGIKGEPVGRWPIERETIPDGTLRRYEERLKELARFRILVHEEVIIESERKILDKWLDDRGAR